MFKKHKQLITGFILGAIVFGTMPVQAKVQEYLLQKSTAKVMVDGKEFANKELPVMNYKGYNYIPMATFREICDNIGIDFKWVGESSEVQISTGKNEAVKPVEKVIQPIEERKSESMVQVEKDGYELTVVDGVEYIRYGTAHRSFEDGFVIDVQPDKTLNLVYQENTEKSGQAKGEKVLIENIPYEIIDRTTYITYSYFKDTILPIIKAEGN